MNRPLSDTDKKAVESNRLHAAIMHAAQIVVAKDFMGTYQSAQMQVDNSGVKNLSSAISKIGTAIGDKNLMSSELDIRRNMQAMEGLLNVAPDQWAKDFQAISKKRKAIELFERAIDTARPKLAAASAELSDTHPDKPAFPAECSAAYRRTREHLIANPQSPRWLALLLFTLARAIGSNTRSAFASHEWHDGTFFWFDIERAWLQGDGVLVGKLLLDADKLYFSNQVAGNLGSDMPRRLAESAAIAPGWSLFNPPW